jgi:hypothetical protein
MIPPEAEAFQDVSEPATADVFICYARSDYQFVKRLEDALEKNGKSVRVNGPDTFSSDESQQRIQSQIEASQNILVILSPDFVKSLYNRQELTYVASLKKRLIPILYRESFTPDELPPEIANIQWLPFQESDDFDRTFLELLKILNTDFDTFTLQATPVKEMHSKENILWLGVGSYQNASLKQKRHPCSTKVKELVHFVQKCLRLPV